MANLQTMGPMYIGDTGKRIFDEAAGMMLAGRMIITAGMGNTESPVLKLHGPLPIPEISSGEYETYYLIANLHQKPTPSSEFTTGEGSYIICIIYKIGAKHQYRQYENMMEKVIQSVGSEIDFANSFTGDVTARIREEVVEKLQKIFDEINKSIALEPLFESNSLFDIGLLAEIPDEYAKVVKKLILHPKGLPAKEITDDYILTMLTRAGLLSEEDRDGTIWVIPR